MLYRELLLKNIRFNLINHSLRNFMIDMKNILILPLLLIVFASYQTNAQCVNFTKYQPPTWDNPIVVSAITGTNTSETAFYENQTLYIDIAIQNNGTCNATQAVTAYLFLDGVYKNTLNYSILNSGNWQPNLDFVISGTLAVGNHTIQVDIDGSHSISESNESDNTFTRTFTVGQGACVSTPISTVFNGSRTFNTEHYTNTNFRIKDQCQTANIMVRDWNSTNTTPNALEITSGNNSWTLKNQQFGGSVMWAAKSAYNYYSAVHSRSSYNGSNGSIDGYINAVFSDINGNLYTDNASMSFTGGFMKVGLGSSGPLSNSWCPLDVIAHEYTHAVTGSSAALAYQNESGALNESFSDIFGECVENYTVGSNDWLFGANRTSGAYRSLANPNIYSQPDTYLGTNWFTGTGDNGGVHTNSGVQNYWFYLLSQGGSGTNDNGNAFNVTGLGITAARAIAFRTLTVNLFNQPNANYATARTASIQSADDLYGVNSTQSNAVKNAWCAVGLGVVPTVVTVTGGGTFCTSATLTASGGASGTIYWQGTTNGGTSTTTPSTSQVVTSSGTYYFRATNGCGWGTQGSVTVTINTAPSAVSVSGGGTFCNSTTITASGGTGGTIYWQGTTSGGTSAITPSSSQVVNSSGTYYFRANNSCGWGTQGSATVTISTPPSAVSVSGGGTFCNSTTITASGGTGGTIYWQGTTTGGTSTATPSTNQLVNSSGTYYFRSYNSTCGWGAEGSVTVTINTTYLVAVYGGGNYCNSATLSVFSANGGSIYYQSTTSGGTSTLFPVSTQLTVSSSGTYYFRVLNSCGWGPEGSVTVIIETPTLVTVSGGGNYCNANATLTALNTGGGTLYYQGTTSGGTSTAIPSASQIVSTTGVYYFRAFNSCGWGTQGSAIVNVIANVLNLTGIATNGIQKAGQTISSIQNIPSGINTSYEAGNSILLQGTFNAEPGSVLKAEIKGCIN
jgi:Zn-dependent metalloprotease